MMNKRKICTKKYNLHIPGFPIISHKVVYKSLSSYECKQLQKFIQDLYKDIIKYIERGEKM